ncbi:L-2-hydroxyglutarate oxidase [Aquimarina mytili]|uniref:L-2-hydroxyglutarate oxidase n=1 Tax=Aquimarina mytili TaxID=874423 RepID=A0A936ZSL2_9FLAO|nr:L-2-hydroxyglutarate oxidase [Aquimarina mytili]MBL0684662.1 L-2-hydroxyglutarate oxidase [Aquimarina mytili]
MKYDVTIIGAGIVGLSTAYNLSKEAPHLKIAVLEKENSIASHQTGHNSGVIHSGIYYKPGSAKATNCRNGYNLLLEFCKEEKIHHEICGKIIVATNSDEEKKLQNIYDRGVQNGLKGLKFLDENELKEKEPNVSGTKGIFVPQAGIVDYKEVSKKLFEKGNEKGVNFFFEKKVAAIKKENEGYEISTGDEVVTTKFLVNCAGLYSDKIAKMDGVNLNARIIPFRGEYYLLKDDKAKLVNNLIYPVPDPNFPFLGVHFTRRINGKVDAGPNAVLAFRREGYTKSDIDLIEFLESISYLGFIKVALKYWKVGAYEMYRSFSKKAFVKSLQKLVPQVKEEDLIVGEAGVRAQLCDKRGNLVDDFLIEQTKNGVHVVNAPSPAATSSLNIGKEITKRVLQSL